MEAGTPARAAYHVLPTAQNQLLKLFCSCRLAENGTPLTASWSERYRVKVALRILIGFQAAEKLPEARI